MIYDYVLDFNEPLRHVTKMKPFGEKLIDNSNITWSQLCAPGGPEANTTADASEEDLEAESEPSESSRHPVNTAILVANKLVYSEAISVFYDNNTIHFEPQLCWAKDLTPLRTSELSLAKHLVVKIDSSMRTMGSTLGDLDANSGLAFVAARKCIPEVFTRLRSGIVYLPMTRNPNAMLSLFHMRLYLRNSSRVESYAFDGVGSMIATIRSHAALQMRVQCKPMMEHCAKCAADPVPEDSTLREYMLRGEKMSANVLRRFEMANPGHYYARTLLDSLSPFINHERLAVFFDQLDHDSHEFWTIVEQALHNIGGRGSPIE